MGLESTATGWLDSDWSQFVPDLFSGAATGVAAGLTILAVQKWGEARAERRDADFLWQTSRPAIAAAVRRPWTSAEDLRQLPQWVDQLEEVARGLPLGVWDSTLGYPSIRALRSTLAAIGELRSSADYAELDLIRESRRAAPSGFVRDLFPMIVRRLVIGQQDSAAIARELAVQEWEVQELMGPAQHALERIPGDRVFNYRSHRQALEEGYATLLAALAKPDVTTKAKSVRFR